MHVGVCTKDRRCVLAYDAAHALCRSVWQEAHFWRVGQYVIMPDHIHLFCSPGRIPAPSLKQWVEYWKGRIAAQWPRADASGADGTEPVPPGCRNGGPTSVSAVPGVTTKLWPRDFWDTQMRGRDHFNEKLAYVRMNPVRKGLVTVPADWPYQGEVFPFAWM